MDLKILHQRSWKELVEILRQVPLLGDRKAFPYKKAKIETRLVDVSEVKPISYYVLKDNIKFQKELRDEFLKMEIDTLDLNGKRGSVIFDVMGERGNWIMSAPIVEISEVDGGVPVLLDGEHRFWLAKKLNKKVRAIWVSNISKKYPVVGKPIGWDEVKEYSKTPSVSKKRDYRFKDEKMRYHYYRDINQASSTGVRQSVA